MEYARKMTNNDRFLTAGSGEWYRLIRENLIEEIEKLESGNIVGLYFRWNLTDLKSVQLVLIIH